LEHFIDMLSIILPFDLFYGRLVYFVVIWYLFPVLVYCAKKNLATLLPILLPLLFLLRVTG
jgi:hypothetical protein